MTPIYTAVATTIGGRAGQVKSSDGLIDFQLRPPKEMGGPEGNYTNPEQLFAAGYSACFGSALSHVALAKNIRLKPDVTARVSIGAKEGGGFQLAVELDVNLKEVDQATAEELTREAHQVCPYSNATRGNIEVTLNVNGKNL